MIEDSTIPWKVRACIVFLISPLELNSYSIGKRFPFGDEYEQTEMYKYPVFYLGVSEDERLSRSNTFPGIAPSSQLETDVVTHAMNA